MSPITNVVPLSLVLFVSLVKEAFEDWVSTAVLLIVACTLMYSFIYFGLGFFKENFVILFFFFGVLAWGLKLHQLDSICFGV